MFPNFAIDVLRAAVAMQPQAHESLMGRDFVVSGLSAGYFIAWGARFAHGYARAPGIDPGERLSCVASGAR